MARSTSDRASSSFSSSKRKRSSKDSEAAAVSAAESSADESFVSARSSHKSKSKSKSDKDDSKKSRKKDKSSPSKKSSRRQVDHDTTDAETDDYASAHDGAPSVPSSSKGKSSSSSHPSTSEQYLMDQPLSSAFEIQYPVITLSIPPIHASQPTVALSEIFDSLVMRFIPPLNGVLVSHGESYFLVNGKVSKDEKDVPPSAIIDSDGAFASVRAAVECCVWRPRIGQKIQGRITLSTPSHVSLLIHSTFNASIPSNHMEDYEYIEGPSGMGNTDEDEEMLDSNNNDDGYWRHKITKERLGSDSGLVTFIVIGLTISSPSLSLTGSLLSKPFSIPPPRSTMMTNTMQSTANAFGFGNEQATAKVTFADDTATNEDDAAAIKKATRKVRWEEDDDYTTTDGEHTDTDGEQTRKHVKF